MIQDSVPWKMDLMGIAGRLEKRKARRRWTDRTGFLGERDVMMGAYSVRRLRESFKISDDLVNRAWPVRIHDQCGPTPDVYNRHKFWDLYDLEKGRGTELSLANVCNQVIHSWIWGFAAGKKGNGLGGIFVSSDRKRKKCLYFMSVDMLVDLFRSVGEEDVCHIEMRRDEVAEMKVTRIVGRSDSAVTEK
ncbi:hypothetical protein [Streptomyces luteolus]|uniref:Uncharacterized protein n=1 Tax=Streptomyces luteolus TaxID=3043615 RepID=A0ABT6TB89_9ACTN|nr:hypothetical protein [Streptomyces sp. B-S-A12]MDI3424152.1 hypothetical protein [Streptomyces sp. B-S-A12]